MSMHCSDDSEVGQGVVVVRQYALGAPLDWGDDIDNELRRENRLWNTLVEIDRYARDRYREAIDATGAMGGLGGKIDEFVTLKEDLFTRRRARFASARAKGGVDTSDLDREIDEVRTQLREKCRLRNERLPEAKREAAKQLAAIETERKEFVKLARQRSGLFWCNYNAVIDDYNRARMMSMRKGIALRFHRFYGGGRLVNQIQGGMSAEDLFAGRSSQVSISLGASRPVLTVTAYTGRGENGKRFRRTVSFPIVLHREFPPAAVIKSVSVSVRLQDPRVRTMSGHAIREIGHAPAAMHEYAVTFTCRTRTPGERPAGTAAAGVNLGWKQVPGGLRTATAAFPDGTVDHLVLPDDWVRKLRHADELQRRCDQEVNALLPRLREALHGLPSPDDGVLVEGVPEYWHRHMYRLLHTRKTSVERLLRTLFDLRLLWEKEPTALPMLHDLAGDLEAWRRHVKKDLYLPRRHIDQRCRRRRTHIYRTWASRLVNRAGLIAIDATSYEEAARLRSPDTDESTDMQDRARSNRFLVAPFELRLAIEQCAAKRGAQVERYSGLINRCRACSSADLDGGLDGSWRTCKSCGAELDVDETAAKNLLDWATGIPSVESSARRATARAVAMKGGR